MLPQGSARKVTIYLNEDTRRNLTPLWNTIVGFLRHHHVAGATLFRADAGFGSHGQYHNPYSEFSAERRPIRIEFIETAERAERLLPELYDLVTDGLITVQDVIVIKSVSGERRTNVTSQAPRRIVTTKGKLLRVYLGESDRLDGEPLYDAIVKRLHMEDCSGVTVYRGILGYGAKRHTRKGGRFHVSHDLPIMISVVETTEKVNRLIEIAAEMLQDGIIVTSDAELHKVMHELPETGESVVTDR